MPTPDQMNQAQNPQMKRLLQHLEITAPSPGLASDIALLREEIAALRAELAPVSSLILTGRDVVEQFKRLRNVA